MKTKQSRIIFANEFYKPAILLFIALFLVTGAVSCSEKEFNKPSKQSPNFILFLVDDHGWYGTPVKMDDKVEHSYMPYKKMPNLVKFAQGAMRFTNAYSPAPACGPSRASIQSGRTTAGNHYVDHREGFTKNLDHKFPLMPAETAHEITPEIRTIADILKSIDARYATANFGKWHVSIDTPPGEFGYDYDDGNNVNSGIANTEYPNPKDIVGITDRSVKFMKECVGQEKPFYLQMSHYAVHGPARYSPETWSMYENQDLTKLQKEYGAMAEDMDVSLGKIIQTVKELGIEDNTYIIYTSDNGLAYICAKEPAMRNYVPLRGNKMTIWEGGIRVPLFVKGPGVEPSTCNEPVVGYDILPTLADLAGGLNKVSADVDGGSWKNLLNNDGLGSVQRRSEGLLFHYPVYRDTQGQHPGTAFRLGDYKLIHYYETGKDELYNLSVDIGETNDLAEEMPDKVKQMVELMNQQLELVHATYPTKW